MCNPSFQGLQVFTKSLIYTLIDFSNAWLYKMQDHKVALLQFSSTKFSNIIQLHSIILLHKCSNAWQYIHCNSRPFQGSQGGFQIHVVFKENLQKYLIYTFFTSQMHDHVNFKDCSRISKALKLKCSLAWFVVLHPSQQLLSCWDCQLTWPHFFLSKLRLSC